VKATPSHILKARELAQTIDVPEHELYRMAGQHHLPFFRSKCGFGISVTDLPSWAKAAAEARNEKEKRK
jgi:hypothetical protein